MITEPPDVTVRKVESNQDLDACFALRMRVFVDEQGVPPWEEVDHFDETADHFAALIDGRVVGTARLVEKSPGVGKIGRVAVEQKARARGVGRALMLHIMNLGFKRYETLALEAQVQVIPFYEKLGFVAEGPVFLDAGIEHRLMKLKRPVS